MMAASNGHEFVVERLLRVGASVNLSDSRGFTPLMRATKRGQERVVEVLLELGADVHVQDESKRICLGLGCTGMVTPELLRS